MNQRGFTKIELLVVVTIIGLLGILAVVAVSTARARTRDAVRLSDVRQIQTGIELYFNDRNAYPEVTTAVPVGEPSARCLGESGFAATCTRSLETVYLEAIAPTPKQGINGDSSCGGINNAYCYTGSGQSYRIQFELERDQPILNLRKGVNCATEDGLKAGICEPLENAEVES